MKQASTPDAPAPAPLQISLAKPAIAGQPSPISLANIFMRNRLQSGGNELAVSMANPVNGHAGTLTFVDTDGFIQNYELSAGALTDVIADERLNPRDRAAITVPLFIQQRTECAAVHPIIDYTIEAHKKGETLAIITFAGADDQPRRFVMDDSTLQSTLMSGQIAENDRKTLTMALHYVRVNHGQDKKAQPGLHR